MLDNDRKTPKRYGDHVRHKRNFCANWSISRLANSCKEQGGKGEAICSAPKQPATRLTVRSEEARLCLSGYWR